jgi:hypothetical protein
MSLFEQLIPDLVSLIFSYYPLECYEDIMKLEILDSSQSILFTSVTFNTSNFIRGGPDFPDLMGKKISRDHLDHSRQTDLFLSVIKQNFLLSNYPLIFIEILTIKYQMLPMALHLFKNFSSVIDLVYRRVYFSDEQMVLNSDFALFNKYYYNTRDYLILKDLYININNNYPQIRLAMLQWILPSLLKGMISNYDINLVYHISNLYKVALKYIDINPHLLTIFESYPLSLEKLDQLE